MGFNLCNRSKLVLAAVILTTTFAARAEIARGHFRNNGTYVLSYYRTPASGIVYDNRNYRGYSSQQPSYVSPRSYSPTTLPYYGDSSYSATPYTVSGASRSYGNTTYATSLILMVACSPAPFSATATPLTRP